ncbi:MAG: RNase adapter RapZ [Deltaproteobacteria bacterium]|nr:RNase adapter RapZ [Deltaproteobacteria bacterium]
MVSQNKIPVIIVTGLSGAGKSTALHVLEDLGFYCVDGLPARLAPVMVDLFAGKASVSYRGLALGMDLRQEDFGNEWKEARSFLGKEGWALQILFLEADAQILFRRYATTRRPHPLEGADIGLEAALAQERESLAPIRAEADLVLDTTSFSIHDLRRVIQERWSFLEDKTCGFRIHMVSFGFKYGVPIESDLVFDLRFLANPYFDVGLRPLSGQDQAVFDFVFNDEPAREFLDRFEDFLLFLLPRYATEGRYRLTMALGCTGGRHRSVATAEVVAKTLRQRGYAVTVEHRHLALG